MSVLRTVGTRATPQTEPVLGKAQVQNNAGGYVFEVDDFTRLQRFLILGVDQGTYYAAPRPLAVENAAVVKRCLDTDYKRTVDLICDISVAGRAPKNDPALFALAMATAHPKANVYALSRLGDVARIGTHLFHFAQFVEGQRGWGRGLRKAVARWYEGDADKLAYQLVKYRNRDGWTHKDLLRLAHPEAPTEAHKALYDFVCGREVAEVPRIVEGYLKIKDADVHEAAELVREYKLPWETIDSQHLTNPIIWDSLLESDSLPLTALVRNLGVMTARGVLAPGSNGTNTVITRLSDVEAIKKARLHPIAVLNALITYQNGVSRGGVTWQPVSRVVDALDAAFYSAFKAVEPANKRTLLGIDISGSMGMGMVANASFSARVGSAAFALVTAATEPETISMGFSHQFVPLDVSPRRRLDDQVRAISGLPFGGTDCAVPMLWATKNKIEVDTFVVITDNETWAGGVHPFQALKQYRHQMGIDARMIVVGMTATEFSIADKSDAGMMDVVGFDTTAPGVISDFSAGRL